MLSKAELEAELRRERREIAKFAAALEYERKRADRLEAILREIESIIPPASPT